ncbi:MAG: hypothetical protein AB7Q42_05320 [Acidimicrobiia bacterium]
MDEQQDRRAGILLAAGLVSSTDVYLDEEEDRRTRRGLIVACLAALALAAAVGFSDVSTAAVKQMSATPMQESSLPVDAPEPCLFSPAVVETLPSAETPWEYMTLLGYSDEVIDDVLNRRAEEVMREHVDGRVQWDPPAQDGRYSETAQLSLSYELDGVTVTVRDTQQIMAMLRIEGSCSPATSATLLPVLS